MAVSITRTANPAGVNSSSSVATYSGVSIGAAAPNRIVVVAVASELASTPINSCTIDYGSGNTAMTAGSAGNFGAVYARLFYLPVPTGTTATIKVTWGTNSPTSTQNHIAVYSVVGGTYSSAGNDGSTDMDATDPLTTGSITIASGGGFIAVAGGATDTAGKTWANATEDIDADAGALRFTTATRTTALTTTAVTCTGTTNGEDGALSYIIFTENTSPTVALNSPADAASTGDLTPTLNFTGTDTDSDAVEYQVQVDTLNTFNGVVISSDDFNRANENPIGGNWTNNALGEGADNQLKIVSNQLQAVTAATSCEAYWNANTFSTDTDLEMYFTVVTKPGNGQRVEMGYMQDLAGLRDMYQMLLIDNTGAGNDTFLIQRVDNAAATTLATSSSLEYTAGDVIGFRRTRDGVFSIVQNGSVVLSTSPDTTYTGNFYAEVCIRDTTGVLDNWGVKKPLIDALSTTDAGFTAGHPFASGAATDYTVQSDLTASTTYYWRARAIDPSGSNTWGAWSSTRSFVATAGGTETREPNPVTATLSVVAPTKSYEAVISRSPSAIALSLAIAAVTTSYLQIGSASPNPVTTTLSVAAPSTSYAAAYSRSLSALSTTLSIASPSISYVYVGSASPSPVQVMLSAVAPSKSYVQINSSSPNPVSLTLTQVQPSTSYIASFTRSVDPVIITASVVQPSSSYLGVFSRSPSAIGLTLSVAAPSTSFESTFTRNPNPLSATLSVAAPTASAAVIVTRNPDPVSATLAVVQPSTSYLGVFTRSPNPVTLTSSIAAPTKSYEAVITRSPSPVTTTLSVVAPTQSYQEVVTRTPDSVVVTLSTVQPSIGYESGQEYTQSPLPILLSLSVPAVTRSATVDDFTPEIIFADWRLAINIFDEYYLKL